MSKLSSSLFRIALLLGLILFGGGIVGAVASTFTPLGRPTAWLWLGTVGIVLVIAQATLKANVSHE